MKNPLAILLLLFSFVSAQDIESLTAEQKKEYNRRKITVELESTQGGAIVGNAFFSNQRDIWKAYRGISEKLTKVEFYRIVGYKEEANRLEEKRQRIKAVDIGAILIGLGGLVLVPDDSSEDLGGILLVVSMTLMYASLIMEAQLEVAPYETAVSIADDYNRELLNEIISR